jgi:hypothetical protein
VSRAAFATPHLSKVWLLQEPPGHPSSRRRVKSKGKRQVAKDKGARRSFVRIKFSLFFFGDKG